MQVVLLVAHLMYVYRQSLADQNLILFTPDAAGPWWLLLGILFIAVYLRSQNSDKFY